MAMLLLLLLSASFPIFIIIFLLATQYKSRRWAVRHPPGPKGLPFIGNLHQIDVSKPHVWLTKLSHKYGPLMFMKLCRVPLLVISSADVAEKALKKNDVAFAGRPCTSASFRLSYDHSDIVTSFYTEYWREMRKMVVQHLFSSQKIRSSFRPVREDEVSSMIAGISKKANEYSNQLIDIGETVSSFNSNVLCRIAFGKKLDQGTRRQLEKIISQYMASLLESLFIDGFAFGYFNKLSGAARRVEKVFEEMDSFYQQLIDEHLDPDRPDSMTNDIVDLLIQLKEDKSAAVKLDWKHVKAIVMDVFIGGTDTNAASLTWAMTALIKHPDVMKKVQEEIRSLVGKKSLVDEDVQKLPYFKAVIKEIMRLYPPIPLIPKETIEDSIINGYNIEAKTLVLVNTWAICRDPEYWENANEFLPERFLNTSFDFKGRDFGFIPFGSGRRICPGASLAIANMEVALANLLYFFDWEIPNGKTGHDIDTDATIGIILHKKNPLLLLAKPV